MENNNSQYAKRGQIDGLEILDKSDKFGEKYEVFVNGIKQGHISKSDDENYFVRCNSVEGGKSFNSKFFDSLLKAKKYVYSKTKNIFPLSSKTMMKQMGYAKGGTIGHRTNGEINATYLDSFSEIGQERILNNIANHYGIHLYEANDEVRSDEAEMLYEYIADDDALKMMIYSDLKEGGYAKGGEMKKTEIGKRLDYMFEDKEYHKPRGKTIYRVVDVELEDDEEWFDADDDKYTTEEFENYDEAKSAHAQSEVEGVYPITWTTYLDTKKAPFVYESGIVLSDGRLYVQFRKGITIGHDWDGNENGYENKKIKKFADGGDIDERETRFQKENDLLQSVDKDYVIVMYNKKTKRNEILTSPDTFQTQRYRYTSLMNKGQLVGFEKIKIVQLQDLDFTYKYDGDLFAKGGEVDKKKYKFEITEYKDKNAVINDEPTLSDYEGTKEKVVDFEYQRMQRGYCVYFNITIVADSNNEGWFFESDDLYDLTDKIENSDDDDYEDNDYENDVMKIYGYAKGGEIERGSAHMYIDMSNGNYKVYHGNDVKLRANAHPLHTFTNASEGTYNKIWQILQNNGYAKGDDVERGSAHMYITMSNGNYKVYHGNDVKLRANAHPLHTFTNASEGTYDKIWEILRGKQFAEGGEVGEINIAKQYGKMLNDLSKEKQFNKKIELNSKVKNFEKQNEISIDQNNIIYIKGNRVAYIDKINSKTGQQKTNWEIKKFAQGGKVAQKVFVAEEDGILGIVSGSDAYSIQISKGDTFATHGEQDDSNWWYVKKVDAKPTTMSENNTFDDTKSKSRVKVNWDELLLTFPRGDKMMYAQMTESKPKASPKRLIKRKG